MTSAVLPASRSKHIVLWILRILMAALFLFASYMKLTGSPMMVDEYPRRYERRRQEDRSGSPFPQGGSHAAREDV